MGTIKESALPKYCGIRHKRKEKERHMGLNGHCLVGIKSGFRAAAQRKAQNTD